MSIGTIEELLDIISKSEDYYIAESIKPIRFYNDPFHRPIRLIHFTHIDTFDRYFIEYFPEYSDKEYYYSLYMRVYKLQYDSILQNTAILQNTDTSNHNLYYFKVYTEEDDINMILFAIEDKVGEPLL